MSSFEDFNDRLSFLTLWIDNHASNEKKFILNYYPCDNTLDLIDISQNNIFLKRCTIETIEIKDLFIGNHIRIYGRQIKIIDYANQRTARYVGKTREQTLALIKPDAIDKIGDIITLIERNDFQISNLIMTKMDRVDANKFYEYQKDMPNVSNLIENLTSGPIVAMELTGENALDRWNQLCGPLDPVVARRTDPRSLRALFGLDIARNALHGSINDEQYQKESNKFFKEKAKQTQVILNNTTCCIIKPHVLQACNFGELITELLNNQFSITLMQMFYLNKGNIEEFLEVYKGVVSDYNALVSSFLDGPCVALEISGKCGDMNVHDSFRKLCGPLDTSLAKEIRSKSLRAKFGVNKYKNAVHCTDLEEDTDLELEYFFKILNSN